MTRAPAADPRHRVALWAAFGLVHAWLTFLGVVAVPTQAFHDVDLYRWWMYLGLADGHWPVLDDPFVYPAGAVLPMLLPALVAVTNPGYALAWCVMVTALDVAALAALLRTGRGAVPWAGWWWTAFLLLLGPVALGRLDAVVAPLVVLALVAARGRGRTATAAVLLTVGAWIKVAPGALLLPLATASRRPVREVVLPAGAVCAVVVGAVTLGGGLSRVADFLTTQGDRGLQVESVAATLIGGLHRDDMTIGLNEALITYEVDGPGAATAAGVLDVLLPLAVAAVAVVLLLARRRGTADDAVLPAVLVLVTVLIVANKVGSPQFVTWFTGPVAVLLAVRRRADGGPGAAGQGRWLTATALVLLVVAGLTQWVFPWGYLALLSGDALLAAVLTVRNVLLLAVLALGVVGLVGAVRGAPQPGPAGRVTPGGP